MIVLKFGGRLLADPLTIRRALALVTRQMEERPLVVVSAIGETTNRLVEIVRSAFCGRTSQARAALGCLMDEHRRLAAELLEGPGRRRFEEALNQQAREIIPSALKSTPVASRPARRDQVLALGERLSSLLFSLALQACGVPARLLEARQLIRTDENFGRARVLAKETEKRLAALRTELVPGEVPVLGGFVGSSGAGRTTTLGRGGSDLTATLVGAALEARSIQIWTDVPGILTADPRRLSPVLKVRRISYAGAAALAGFGARVLHPACLAPARRRGIPLRVGRPGQEVREGTLISSRGGPAGMVQSITLLEGLTLVDLAGNEVGEPLLERALRICRRQGRVPRILWGSGEHLTLALEGSRQANGLRRPLASLGRVHLHGSVALLVLVGEELGSSRGAASRALRSLETLTLLRLPLALSPCALVLILEEEEGEVALRRLHSEFFRCPDSSFFEEIATPCSLLEPTLKFGTG